MQKDFDCRNKRATAALAGGGCSSDVRNNGRRTTVYLHARNRFSFYFCANMRPIACERSFPRLGQLAQNAVYRLMSRDMNRQLVGVGWFSLFAAACLRKLMLPRNHPIRSFQLSDMPYSPERECFSQTIISNTTPYLLRMITLPMCESSGVHNENVENEIATLASGDFVYEDSTSNRRGFVNRDASIAKRDFMSSIPNNLVDILKPAEGIEPSESRLTNLRLRQAAGSLYCTT